MSDTLDKANDAAEGDLGALKYLVSAFAVLALLAGVVVGGVYYVGESIGEKIRDAFSDMADGATQNAPTSNNSTSGYGGGS